MVKVEVNLFVFDDIINKYKMSVFSLLILFMKKI